MIIQSIAWALVLALFNLKLERPHRTRSGMLANLQANTGMNWARWFAALSPVIGVSCGALGVFILTH